MTAPSRSREVPSASHGTGFGLLPEPEGRSASFVTSAVVNVLILALVLLIGLTAKHTIERHRYEHTELTFPTEPPPPKVNLPAPPKLSPPPEMKVEAPKITMPKPEPKPDMKPVQMETKVTVPVIKAIRPSVVLAPQLRAALTAAAPAQVPQTRPSTALVHLGQIFGGTPNPNTVRPATVAALGNPFGGQQGPGATPRGVVGSAGISNGTWTGSNAGVIGKVASAGIPGATRTLRTGSSHVKVVSAGIPAITTVAAAPRTVSTPISTNLEILSKPPVQYTSVARQLKIQGDVILRVTFTAGGQVAVQGVVHGLGYGLDDEARRVAQQIRFRPATRNGQAVDMTTNITITFQLA